MKAYKARIGAQYMNKVIAFAAALALTGCAGAPKEPPPPSAMSVAVNDCMGKKTPYLRGICVTQHPRYSDFSIFEKEMTTHGLVYAEKLDKGQITQAEFNYEINRFAAERQAKINAQVYQTLRDLQLEQSMNRPRFTNCYNNFGYSVNCTTF